MGTRTTRDDDRDDYDDATTTTMRRGRNHVHNQDPSKTRAQQGGRGDDNDGDMITTRHLLLSVPVGIELE